jgi:hypothetical protein
MQKAIHRNQERSDIPRCSVCFACADREGPFGDDSADRHGPPPYGFPMRGPSFHGDEKETRLPLMTKKGAPIWHTIDP